ncbi:hypothetical protein [Streptomyces sp. NPDC002537]
MHFHGYRWLGDKADFDKESVRRPPSSMEPTTTSPQDVAERYRAAVTEWRVAGVPPLETAYWLLKPSQLIRGTWEEAKEVGEWLGEQLAEYTHRFSSVRDKDAIWQTVLVASAVERLGWGGDVSHGFYLGRPKFLSLALVTCCPNRARPDAPCPLATRSCSV